MRTQNPNRDPFNAMTRTLYLIDGHSQMFKAYYAIRNLSNSRGQPTNMIFGFVQMLNRALKEFEPQFLAVIFDAPGPVFRSRLYPAYKANRSAPPEDFLAQLPRVKQLLDAWGIARLEVNGFEADDLIASYTAAAREAGFDVRIISADKDLYQLVDDRVQIVGVKNDNLEFFDRAGVKHKMGVEPERMLDFQGLTGDPVDNIPGIPKVGPKTAQKLLEQFGTLDGVLERAAEIESKALREKVLAHKADALLSRRLAELKRDVPLPLPLEQLRRKPEDRAALGAVFHELEFRAYQREYPVVDGMDGMDGMDGVDDETDVDEGGDLELILAFAPAPAAAHGSALQPVNKSKLVSRAAQPKVKYHTVTIAAELRRWAARFQQAELLAFDTETDEVDPMRAGLVGISLSDRAHQAIYIPLGHATLVEQQLTLEETREILGPLFADPKIPKTAQNAKFDLKLLERHGFTIHGLEFDTLVAAYLLNPDAALGLKKMALERLGLRMTEISELIGSGRNQLSMRDVEIEKAAPYACMDADATLQLTGVLAAELREQQLERLYREIELPLIPILHRMETAGVKIDKDYFARLSREFAGELAQLAEQIYACSGRVFTINSPKQVAELLFEELKLPADKIKKGKSGVYSTDVGVLETLAQLHPLPKLLLEYRKFEKLKGTYVDPLPAMIHPRTGRIHTTFSQTIAATGRLSSNHPNLQNIPVRTQHGRAIRRGFIPEKPGDVFLAADYSQIELRVLAHVTRDPALIRAFRDGDDVHRLTAAKIFGVAPEQVDETMRGQAKVVNFGIIYGMSAFRLSNELEIPRNRATQFIDEYFKAYPGVKEWSRRIIDAAREQGWVETLSGRRRQVRNLDSKNFNLRGAAERIAVNTPIQGSAADMIKIAMIRIDALLREKKFAARMILQIHDELIFELPQSEVAALQPLVVQAMESALPLDVPVKVGVKIGRNWEEV